MKNKELEINGKVFKWGSRTYVMGILNVTPDSFSGDGLQSWQDPVVAAIEQAKRFIDAGADMLDVGGESTRPGSEPVSAEEEMGRVLPVVEAIAAEFNTVISIDTFKAAVAKAVLGVGAHLINDVWGLQ
ncbi:MAG: dihydropteroate synthase, partial [Chloroflexota bacterium]